MTFGANYFMNLMNGNTGMGLLGMNGMYGFGTNYDNGMMWANVAMGTVNNIFSAIQSNYAYNDSPSSVGGTVGPECSSAQSAPSAAGSEDGSAGRPGSGRRV